MDLSITLEDGASVSTLSPCAFTRVETVADFHDAVLLALDGVDLSILPVAGALSGFAKPLPVTIIRRVADAEPKAKAEKAGGATWSLLVANSTKGIAATVQTMLKGKATAKALTIDVTALGNTDRAVAVGKALEGFARCLSQRAGRELSVNDIADLVSWIAQLGIGRVDTHIPYGSYPHWGTAMSYAQVDEKRAWTAPPRLERHSRTLVCAVKPNADDLERVIALGHPFGIINAAALRARAPWAAGLSPDKAVALPGYGYALRGSYKPRDGILRSEGPVIPNTPGRDPWGNVVARYQSTWDDLSAISTRLYEETGTALPSVLQEAWAEQRERLRPYAIAVEPVVGNAADLARHGLSSGIKAAQAASGHPPLAVTTVTASSLTEHVERSAMLIGHGCGVRLELSAADVPALLSAWDGVVGIDLAPVR